MRALLIACALAAALCGCAGNAPRTSFYTLDALPARTAADVAGPPAGAKAPPVTVPPVTVSRITVWIRHVTVPEVVDRAQMVVRSAPNRVEIADFHRWAEPLRVGIARVVAADLAAELGAGFLVVAGQPADMQPDIRVSLDVRGFDAVPGEGVSVEALWTVRPGKGGEPRSGTAAAQEAVLAPDHAAIAAAYSRALARLARELAREIERLTP